MIRIRPPLHVWIRHHPLAHHIAGELLAHRAVLNLRTRLLQRDIQMKFGVTEWTARRAVSFARKGIQP